MPTNREKRAEILRTGIESVKKLPLSTEIEQGGFHHQSTILTHELLYACLMELRRLNGIIEEE